APQFFNVCMCSYTVGPNITAFAYAPDSININASYTFNTGATALTVIGKVNTDVAGVPNLNGSINIGSNVTVTQVGGSLPGLPASRELGAINFSSPAISFGAGSSIVSLNNSTTDIKIASNHIDTNQAPLTVTLPDGGSASLATGGGLVLIGPTI